MGDAHQARSLFTSATAFAQPPVAAGPSPRQDDLRAKALMSFEWDGERQVQTMSITENGKTETWDQGTSVGTGLNGWTYLLGNDLEVLYSTTILMDSNFVPPDEPTILIFKDRVFWAMRPGHRETRSGSLLWPSFVLGAQVILFCANRLPLPMAGEERDSGKRTMGWMITTALRSRCQQQRKISLQDLYPLGRRGTGLRLRTMGVMIAPALSSKCRHQLFGCDRDEH